MKLLLKILILLGIIFFGLVGFFIFILLIYPGRPNVYTSPNGEVIVRVNMLLLRV